MVSSHQCSTVFRFMIEARNGANCIYMFIVLPHGHPQCPLPLLIFRSHFPRASDIIPSKMMRVSVRMYHCLTCSSCSKNFFDIVILNSCYVSMLKLKTEELLISRLPSYLYQQKHLICLSVLTLPGTRGTKRQRRCDRFSFLAHV